MPIIKIINGDLLNATEEYIAHQCNCLTVKSYGLAAAIEKRFPWGNIYRKRSTRNCATKTSRDVPGTIQIIHSPNKEPSIICLFGQWTPGKHGYYNKYYPRDYIDTEINRQRWFKQCLDSIDNNSIDSIAMPYLIGCGLAGGDWKIYEKMLNDSTTDIILYRI